MVTHLGKCLELWFGLTKCSYQCKRPMAQVLSALKNPYHPFRQNDNFKVNISYAVQY